jgi:hypothetical protein
MGTSVLLPEHCDILYMCNCKEPINLIFWRRQYFDSPDAVAPAISAITNVFTEEGMDKSLEDKRCTGASSRDGSFG